MPNPSDQAEVLQALADELRTHLDQTPRHQQFIAVPFAIEEGLHETFEGFLADAGTEDGEDELGGLWTNRRPRSELDRLAARLETRAGELGGAPGGNGDDGDDKTPPVALPDGYIPAAELFEEFPDVTSSLSKLVRVLAENPEIGRQGPSPLRMTVHVEDFARFAAMVRGAPGSD